MARGVKLIECIVLILLFFSVSGAKSQNKQNHSFPFVQNYTKLLYQAGNQNWSVTQAKDRVMYFGNSEGLLSYDGQYWQLHRMPNKVIVRAVAADYQGRVYAGGFGEFGYWQNNNKGQFVYQSLTHLIPKQEAIKEEIWKIYVEPNRVLFQSFSAIYVYEQGKIHVVKGQNTLLFLLKAQNRYFVEVISKGLYELKNDSLVHVPGTSSLAGILSVLPLEANKYIIGTAKNGLFLYDGATVVPWVNQATDFLKANQLNNGALLQNKYLVFGTILNGLVVLDKQGNMVHQVSKTSGLQNNTVLSLYADQDQNLWAGLDNGIDRLEVNSPFYFYFDKTGKFGTVYSSIIHDGRIYLGTNQGLFYSTWSASSMQPYQTFDFKIIEGSQGQVWELALLDGQLLCGHNEGTFRVNGDKITKISDFKGGWTIKRLASHPDLLIQGTYNGLVFYKKNQQGNWEFSHQLQGFGEPSRYVEQDNSGDIWVSHAYKGLYRLSLTNDLTNVRLSRYYEKDRGLPKDHQVNVFRMDSRIVFSSNAGFFVYDQISDRFSRYSELNEKLSSFATANRIIKAAGNQYWFINHGKVALVSLAEPGTLKICSAPFSMLNGRMVQYYENISRISNSIYLISIDDGFVVYNTAVRSPKRKALPPVLIRQVQSSLEDSVISIGHSARDVKVPYSHNNISIAFSLPFYSQTKPQFQYFLEGYSQRWSDWSSATQKEFLNLEQGEYRLLVRARIDNEAASPVTEFRFTVAPPWYATFGAYVAYAVLACLLLLLFRHLYLLKLQKDKERIRLKLEKEKEEILRQEAIINEQKLIKLRNEQLQSELAAKSRELANSALNIVSKNELLHNIREEILLLKDQSGKKLGDDQLKKIQRVINDSMTDDYDWNLFETSFNEAHENYFKKLKIKHADLTPNDLKLCAYLRMNMNSKEIASLLNITLRGVEIRRYRLRKKLNLDHERNLVEFLMEV
ncbi:two-component regulator propeller domain-containing protein [Sabulibacter ruber]|uniref:two-component regulator propeller domain-containing protein n=1 Tax=Sabulibacter ruber TaxID=2811901 RepID=UPI001A9621FA|nr:two-component regulator propeller domain-containing protein [Sabulibacter ruber]